MSDPDNVAPGSRRILCGDGAVAAMLDFGSGSSAFGLPTPEESGGHHTWCLLDVPVVSTFPFQSVQERFQQFLGHWIGHGRRHRKESGHPADIERRRLLPGEPTDATPEELLEQAYQRIRAELTSEVLARVKAASPRFFENLVVELLLKMGYGGDRAEAGRAIGQVGDEGVDGIISEDRLGLDVIHIQAKRWNGTVGRPEVQKFVGALHGKRARKGVFITTGTFSADAKDYVAHIEPRVVLIDGQQLAEYMVDLNLGVTPRRGGVKSFVLNLSATKKALFL